MTTHMACSIHRRVPLIMLCTISRECDGNSTLFEYGPIVEQVVFLLVGVVLFIISYKAITDKWPWRKV